MYYALFETGDKQFFIKLMKAFCSTYVKNVVQLYNSTKQEGSHLIDADMFEKHIDANKKCYNPFNCSSLHLTSDCPNKDCLAEHTTVLSEDQQAKFEDLMKAEKNSYCRIHYSGDRKKMWLEIQKMFDSYKIVELESYMLKVLPFKDPNDPVEYLEMYIKHLEIYIDETNKTSPFIGYVYVRSANNSDFSKFQAKLSKLAACDILQNV